MSTTPYYDALSSADRMTVWQAEVEADEANGTRRDRQERHASIEARLEAQATAAREAELAERDAVPSSGAAAIDADPEVAELERRVLDGDESVTAEQLDAARTDAAGRGRLAQLRAKLGERRAAEKTERDAVERVKANEEAARAALAPFTAERFAAAWDAAVAALDDLVALGRGHNHELGRLATLPPDQAPPGAIPAGPGVGGFTPSSIVLDGERVSAVDIGGVVTGVLGATGVGVGVGHYGNGRPHVEWTVGTAPDDPSDGNPFRFEAEEATA